MIAFVPLRSRPDRRRAIANTARPEALGRARRRPAVVGASVADNAEDKQVRSEAIRTSVGLADAFQEASRMRRILRMMSPGTGTGCARFPGALGRRSLLRSGSGAPGQVSTRFGALLDGHDVRRLFGIPAGSVDPRSPCSGLARRNEREALEDAGSRRNPSGGRGRVSRKIKPSRTTRSWWAAHPDDDRPYWGTWGTATE